MKKYNKTIKVFSLGCFVALIVLCISCSKNEYITYDANQLDAVYFDASTTTDSIFYNFGFGEQTEQIINVRAYLMGLPRTNDRSLSISLSNERYNDDTVEPATSDYFSIPETITLQADSIGVNIPITLKRHQDLETIRTIITLNLESSQDFAVRGHSEYTITFDDKTPPVPAWWDSWFYGEFTKFKGQLFFRYFRELKDENEALYNTIVKRWGEFLEIEPNKWGSSPLTIYRITFEKYVQQKMYDYSLANPDLNLNISEPELN